MKLLRMLNAQKTGSLLRPNTSFRPMDHRRLIILRMFYDFRIIGWNDLPPSPFYLTDIR